jgi:hypothetical protein
VTVITIPDDLARQIADASQPIVFVDANGRQLAEVRPIVSESEIPIGLSAERWAEIQRRFREPGEYVTFDQVKAQLGW